MFGLSTLDADSGGAVTSLWFALLGLGLAPVMVGATEVIVGNAPMEHAGVAGGLQQARCRSAAASVRPCWAPSWPPVSDSELPDEVGGGQAAAAAAKKEDQLRRPPRSASHRRRPRARRRRSPSRSSDVVHDSFISGMGLAFVCAGVVAVLAAGVAFFTNRGATTRGRPCTSDAAAVALLRHEPPRTRTGRRHGLPGRSRTDLRRRARKTAWAGTDRYAGRWRARESVDNSATCPGEPGCFLGAPLRARTCWSHAGRQRARHERGELISHDRDARTWSEDGGGDGAAGTVAAVAAGHAGGADRTARGSPAGHGGTPAEPHGSQHSTAMQAASPRLGKCASGELCLWQRTGFRGKPRAYELSGIDIESCVPLPEGRRSRVVGQPHGAAA